MKILLMTKQAKARNKANQTEIMIAVEMWNKNVGDLATPDLVFDHLYLGAFATINQVIISIQCYYLAGGMTIECRDCWVIAEDGYR